MRPLFNAAAVLGATLVAALPVRAAGGQIDNFGASALTVTEGSTVDFTASFSIVASGWSYGGSDLNEPAPQEGYQYRNLNWYGYEYESVRGVWLQAGGQSFTDYPNAPAGSSHSGGWTLSILFPTAGTFSVTLSGGWNVQVESYSSNESAWRDCTNMDPGGTNELWCSWWTYEYSGYSDSYSMDGSFGDQTLTIEVLPLQTAAVPEPSTYVLMALGLGVLGFSARRRGL